MEEQEMRQDSPRRLGFVWKIVNFLTQVFGCCFGVNRRGSSPTEGALVTNNQLDPPLFRQVGTPHCEDVECTAIQSTSSRIGDNDEKVLKNEVIFVKSSGTLLETPAEVCRTSEEIKVLPYADCDVSSKSHLRPPVKFGKKIQLEELFDPVSPVKEKNEELENILRCMSEDSIDSAISLLLMGNPSHSSDKDTSVLVTPDLPIPDMQNRRSVRFECGTSINIEQSNFKYGGSPPRSHKESCKQSKFPHTYTGQSQLLGLKHSPYPTPLKLTDEMQTPGTVYPSKFENPAPGMSTRTRCQFVCPVNNSIENLSHRNASKGDHDIGEVCHPQERHEQSKTGNLDEACSSDEINQLPDGKACFDGSLEDNKHTSGTVASCGNFGDHSQIPINKSLFQEPGENGHEQSKTGNLDKACSSDEINQLPDGKSCFDGSLEDNKHTSGTIASCENYWDHCQIPINRSLFQEPGASSNELNRFSDEKFFHMIEIGYGSSYDCSYDSYYDSICDNLPPYGIIARHGNENPHDNKPSGPVARNGNYGEQSPMPMNGHEQSTTGNLDKACSSDEINQLPDGKSCFDGSLEDNKHTSGTVA